MSLLLGAWLLLTTAATGEAPRLQTIHGAIACEACVGVCSEVMAVPHLRDAAGTCYRLLMSEPGGWRERIGQPAQATGYAVADGAFRVEALIYPGDGAVGTFAPLDLALNDLDGAPRRLADLQGRVIVVNFWATWCGPCRAELPALAAVHRAYRGRGVEVIGAASDGQTDRARVRRMVADAYVEYPIWLGANASDQRAFGFTEAIPATAILDRHGSIVWRHVGLVRESELGAALEGVLGGR